MSEAPGGLPCDAEDRTAKRTKAMEDEKQTTTASAETPQQASSAASSAGLQFEFDEKPEAFSPLFLQQPARRTAAVNAGDYRLYLGGGAINAAFGALLKQWQGLEFGKTCNEYVQLHSLMLAESRAKGGSVVNATEMLQAPEAAELMSKLKLRASLGIAGEGSEVDRAGLEAASGAVFLNFFASGTEPCEVANNSAMLYVIGPKGENCKGPKQGPLLDLSNFLLAVERVSQRALELVSEYNRRSSPDTTIQEVRWCLVSGGVYCHPDASKLEVARATLRGMRKAEIVGLEVVTFTYDEDIFQRAFKGEESVEDGKPGHCTVEAKKESPRKQQD
eukprot:TRINITY_DN11390_c0_g1_i1.p1 TRINITY_DN11390_c0_g1~~TRINITY_DN11390_c0_g1_i1.p1  ORF type:complete len:333 (-),score=74.74 TRINITY_DN11390_c0_g1_i1:410-1408(-)